MEYYPLDITVISADDLKDVNLISKMDVFVVVSITNDPKNKRKTPVHKDGGKSPWWNHRIHFDVGAAAVHHQPDLSLRFKIKSQGPFGNKVIGTVFVPIKELLDNYNKSHHKTTATAFDYGGDEFVVRYQVRTPSSGSPKGTLKFSYNFGEKYSDGAYTPPASANMAYLPPPGAGYTPPPYVHQAGYLPSSGYGYGGGYPPAPAYGYPPSGYGYQQPPQQAKKRNGSNFGLGLGAGLLGGLLVGDMISDVGDSGSDVDVDF